VDQGGRVQILWTSPKESTIFHIGGIRHFSTMLGNTVTSAATARKDGRKSGSTEGGAIVRLQWKYSTQHYPWGDNTMKRVYFLALLIALCPAMALAVTNTGSNLPAVFEGHVLSGPTDATAILYAPTESDNPTFRADLAAATGAVVDYFDARYGTPDQTLLADYDAVMTWVNYAYADSELMGDNLADFVDAGGRVILGQWCFYSSTAIPLGGRIMEPEYCPITCYSYASGAYMGDGSDCATDEVYTLESSYNDICTLIPGGVSDGTMSHGGVATAWREDMAVWYSPANTGAYYSIGDWAQLTANMVNCSGGFLFPTVDIKCNGSAGPVTIIAPNPVVLDIDVNPRDAAGYPADVWAIVKAGPGYACYDGAMWTFPVPIPFTGYAMASGPLAAINATILNQPLPAGSYTGFVVIDPLANNRYNATAHNIMDSVDFTVIPAGTEIVVPPVNYVLPDNVELSASGVYHR